MKYTSDDAWRIVTEHSEFMEWIEKRIKDMIDIGIYDVNYIEYDEKTDTYYISWESSHGEYNSASLNWNELADESNETFKAAQAERDHSEKLRRIERAQVEAARSLARAQRMQSFAEQEEKEAGFDLEEWKKRHGVE